MNKSYLKYLFKSKKGLCIALSLLYVFAYLLCFTVNSEEGYIIGLAVISCIFGLFTIIAVPLVYNFVHNKKAVDSYFSLPVTRKEMILTSQLYINLIVAVPFLVLSIASLIIGGLKGQINMYSAYVIYMLIAVIGGAVMTAFATSVYLEANSSLDGAILICAYLIMPFIIWLAIETFQDQFIAGFKPINTGNILSYISLPTSLVTTELLYGEVAFIENSKLFMIPTSLIICLAWHSGVSVVSLRRNFVERKVERAESISNRFFSYPFVIYAYTFILVFSLTANFFIGIQLDALIAYFIVFVAFMVGNFVYRRKIHIYLKDVLFFVGTVVIVLLFSFAAVKTKGFGLSYVYDHNPKNIAFNLDSYYYMDEDNDELEQMVLKIEPGAYNYSVSVDSVIKEKDMAKAKPVLDMLEEKRQYAIKEHYNSGRDYYGSFMAIITNFDEESVEYYYEINNRLNKANTIYNYSPKLTLKEIELLKDYSNIIIEITTEDDYYGMSYEDFVNKYKEVQAQS